MAGKAHKRTTPNGGVYEVKKKKKMVYHKKTSRATPERKFIDNTFSTADITNTANWTLCNNVPQGNGSSEREGRKINMQAVQIRGQFYNIAAASTGYHIMGLLVYDSQPNGAQPAITDVLSSNSVDALNNRYYAERFKIIRRIDIPLGKVGAESEIYILDEYIKLDNLVTDFKNSATGAITDMNKGSLYFIHLSNASGNYPKGNYSIRVSYYDA